MSSSLETIKQNAISVFNNEFGYCGVADMGDTVIINSGGNGETLTVTLKRKIDGVENKKGQ